MSMKKSLLPIVALALLCAGCATVREARKIQNDEKARLPGEYTVPAAESVQEGDKEYTRYSRDDKR